MISEQSNGVFFVKEMNGILKLKQIKISIKTVTQMTLRK